MKRIETIVVLLACALCLCSCETYPHDKATALVTAPYPGKNELNKCKPYADALCKALVKHHIKAWEVFYAARTSTEFQSHAMVVYKDAGAYWYADNIFPYPTKAWGSTPKEWAQDRCNITAVPVGDASIYPAPASSCVILKTYATTPGRSRERIAPRNVSKKTHLYARR